MDFPSNKIKMEYIKPVNLIYCISDLEFMCDGSIKTEDGYEFNVHRSILASRSEYFRTLFCNGISEGEPRREATIPGISGPTMKKILSYLLYGKLHVELEDLPHLLLACDYLMLGQIIDECQHIIAKEINPENCIDITNYVAYLNVPEGLEIQRKCYRYIETHFADVFKCSNIGNISFDLFTSLLSSDNLVTESEETIWDAILKWTDEDPSERLVLIPILLSHLRTISCDDDFLSIIAKHPYFPSLRKLDCESFTSYNDMFQHTVAETSGVSIPTGHRQPKRLLFFVTGTSKCYVTSDDVVDRWWEIGKATGFTVNQVHDVVLISHESQVYMLEPVEDKRFSMDLLTKDFRPMTPMNKQRYNYHVVRCDDHIYAIGGVSSRTGRTIKTVEYFDMEQNLWIRGCSIPFAVKGASVFLNGLIYTVGEPYRRHEGDFMLGQVYNPQTDRWIPFPAPYVFQHDFPTTITMAVFKGCIYVIGGLTPEHLYLSAVVRYDVIKGKWANLKELPFPFYSPEAVVMDGTLLVYENHYEDWKRTKSPPVYFEQESETWLDASRLVTEKPFLCRSCYIEDPETIRGILKDFRDRTPEGAASTWL